MPSSNGTGKRQPSQLISGSSARSKCAHASADRGRRLARPGTARAANAGVLARSRDDDACLRISSARPRRGGPTARPSRGFVGAVVEGSLAGRREFTVEADVLLRRQVLVERRVLEYEADSSSHLPLFGDDVRPRHTGMSGGRTMCTASRSLSTFPRRSVRGSGTSLPAER